MTNRILLFLAFFCFANVCLGQSSQKISTDERQALAAEKSAALAEKQLWVSTGLGLGSLMVTLFIAGAVGWYIPRELERSRTKTECTRTALRLHGEIYSIEFYAMVLVPARRIQLKWSYLASPLAKNLFSHIFGYYGAFLIDLCAKVRAAKPDPEPTWAQNIPQLITKYLEPDAK
jgi:hypothetical protein